MRVLNTYLRAGTQGLRGGVLGSHVKVMRILVAAIAVIKISRYGIQGDWLITGVIDHTKIIANEKC